MDKSKDRIMLAWCDNGMVDGKFMSGVVYTLLTSYLPITNASRTSGNQIGRQREAAFNMWHKDTKIEWLLWVDSDIVITNDVLEKLWEVADAEKVPAISGVYFVSKQNEQSLMEPFPAVFVANEDDKYMMSTPKPMAPDSVMKIDYAGFGLFLMHRSVADKMREFHGDKPLFLETSDGNDDRFIGEDIRFFMNMKEAGIQLHCHTGATVQHMKRFAFDEDYYKLWMITHAVAEEKQKKAEA